MLRWCLDDDVFEMVDCQKTKAGPRCKRNKGDWMHNSELRLYHIFVFNNPCCCVLHTGVQNTGVCKDSLYTCIYIYIYIYTYSNLFSTSRLRISLVCAIYFLVCKDSLYTYINIHIHIGNIFSTTVLRIYIYIRMVGHIHFLSCIYIYIGHIVKPCAASNQHPLKLRL